MSADKNWMIVFICPEGEGLHAIQVTASSAIAAVEENFDPMLVDLIISVSCVNTPWPVDSGEPVTNPFKTVQ